CLDYKYVPHPVIIGAGDQIQRFVYSRQALYQLSYFPGEYPTLVRVPAQNVEAESIVQNPKLWDSLLHYRPMVKIIKAVTDNENHHTALRTKICRITRTWKQPRCPSTEEWIKKMWYIYTMEYYSAEKNNNIMKFAGKCMELENIILNEVTQTQKDKHARNKRWLEPRNPVSKCNTNAAATLTLLMDRTQVTSQKRDQKEPEDEEEH
ncbi:hypothetical protein STEG23_011334, partial [Scotinomys teguina]